MLRYDLSVNVVAVKECRTATHHDFQNQTNDAGNESAGHASVIEPLMMSVGPKDLQSASKDTNYWCYPQ
jgi:hypothetical protein